MNCSQKKIKSLLAPAKKVSLLFLGIWIGLGVGASIIVITVIAVVIVKLSKKQATRQSQREVEAKEMSEYDELQDIRNNDVGKRSFDEPEYDVVDNSTSGAGLYESIPAEKSEPEHTYCKVGNVCTMES